MSSIVSLARAELTHRLQRRALFSFAVALAAAQPLAHGNETKFAYDPRHDFEVFNPKYREQKHACHERYERLKKQLIDQERNGRSTHCARQVLAEAKWCVHCTAQFDRASQELARLEKILAAEKDPHDHGQLADDGSYGCCTHQWFLKLDNSTDELITLGMKWQEPKHPFKLLERIDSPEKLHSYFDSVLVADVRTTGIDTRTELNHSSSALARHILWSGTWREIPTKFALDPGLRKALLDYLDNKWQDPATGYWGTWYKTDAGVVKTSDLSITFHLVSYRAGHVKHWPEIIRTTLAIKDQEYPYGWLEDGQMTNHHNYDVVTLFHHGWPHATDEERKQMRSEIERMLSWCLANTINEDGSFKIGDESTLGGAFYFGVSFLNEIGYFSRQNRFWTDQEFPEAKALRGRIRQKLVDLGSDSPEAVWALWTLGAAGGN